MNQQQKIIGVFNDRGHAMRAREELTIKGFPASDIDVVERPPQAEERGLWDKIKDFFKPGESDVYEEATRRGSILLAVTADQSRIALCEQILQRHNPVDVELEAETWRKGGWQHPNKVPLAQERLVVGKRTVGGSGLRIHTRVVDQPVEEQVRLKEEKVKVERRAVDRPAGDDIFKEQVVEARGSHEEAVVGKEARIVEEISLGTQTDERTETVHETLRKTEVDIEKLEAKYKHDFDSRYRGQNLSYEEYQPAYQLGEQLALDPRFEGQPWNVVAGRVRQYSEQSYPGRWERFEEPIRFGYENALARRRR